MEGTEQEATEEKARTVSVTETEIRKFPERERSSEVKATGILRQRREQTIITHGH